MASTFDGPVLEDDLDYRQIRFRDLVSATHPVRLIEKFIENISVVSFESRYKVGSGQKGRAPKNVKMMLCVILYAVFRRIYSARQIDYATEHHADFWFITYGKRISHDKISDFINLHENDLHNVFLSTINLAHSNNLLAFDALYEDGFLLRANASKKKSYKKIELDTMESRVSERLTTIINQIKSAEVTQDTDDERNILSSKLKKIGELQEQLNQKIAERIKNKRTDRMKIIEDRTTINATDPDSDIMHQKDGSFANSYLKVCAVDSKADIVVASSMHGYNNEPQVALPLVNTANVNVTSIGKYTKAIADASFTRIETCKKFSEAKIQLIGPTTSSEGLKRSREKYIKNSLFKYDSSTFTVTCPNGSKLTEADRYHDSIRDTTIISFTNPAACKTCPDLSNCTTNKKGYRIYRYDLASSYQEQVAENYKSELGSLLYNKRSHVAETFQADLKHNGKMCQLLRRGINKVRVDSILQDITWNLRRIINSTKGNIAWS